MDAPARIFKSSRFMKISNSFSSLKTDKIAFALFAGVLSLVLGAPGTSLYTIFKSLRFMKISNSFSSLNTDKIAFVLFDGVLSLVLGAPGTSLYINRCLRTIRGPGLSKPASFLRPVLTMAPTTDDNVRNKRSVRPEPSDVLKRFHVSMVCSKDAIFHEKVSKLLQV